MRRAFGLLGSVMLGFFNDGIFYGLSIPLTPKSPAGITEDWMYGWISAVYSLGVLLATLASGLCTERLGRRVPMISGAVLQWVGVWLFGYASTFGEMLFARMLMGASSAVLWTTGLAILSERFHKNRSQIFGYMVSANSLGLVLGPISAGYLSELKGFLFPVHLTLILVTVDVLIRFLVTPNAQAFPRQQKLEGELWSLLKDPAVIASSLVVILGAWCWCVLEAILPIHLLRHSGAEIPAIGAVFTVGCLVHGVMSPAAGRHADRRGILRTIIPGLISMALILPWFGLTKGLIQTTILLCVANSAYAFMMNPAISELGAVVDRRGTGAYTSAFAVYNVAYSIGMSGSGLIASFLISRFSFASTLLITSASLLICAPFVLSSFSGRAIKEFFPIVK